MFLSDIIMIIFFEKNKLSQIMISLISSVDTHITAKKKIYM